MTATRRSTGSQEDLRRHNISALLRYVHERGPTSRATLTADLNLNRSTIGALTGELTEAGLVSEGLPTDAGRSRAGRPSLVVRPESHRFYSYALSVEVDRIRAARIGLGGVILDRREADRQRESEVAETAGPLASLVHDMQRDVAEGGTRVGCGVAICGMVRRRDGVVRLSPHTGWVNEPFAAALTDALGDEECPVSVGNVADLSVLAEHTRGCATGLSNVVYLYGDVGIGAGIIAGGRRLGGHAGYGGEVGHMVVHPGGRECGCGSRGCWETEIGERALVEAAGRGDVTGREAVMSIVEAARYGDATAQAATRRIGDWLGFGVGNLVNIFNPEMVLFGGTLREVYLVSAATVRSRLHSIGLEACRENLRLRTPALGNDAALLGAAELAFQPLLGDPLAWSSRLAD